MLNQRNILNLKELNSRNGLIWRHESSCVILILLTYYVLTLMLLTLVHVVCCLSPVKCYSWVHTIIHCILVSILGWPMILTQYMLSRTKSYLCFLCFLFIECSECINDFGIPSTLASHQNIRFQDEIFIQARVDSLGNNLMSLFFGHIPLYSFILVYSILLDLIFGD